MGYGSSTPAAVAGYPVAGYPTITVPAGFAGPRQAIAVGISFIGTRWADARSLHLASAFEAEVGAPSAPGPPPDRRE